MTDQRRSENPSPWQRTVVSPLQALVTVHLPRACPVCACNGDDIHVRISGELIVSKYVAESITVFVRSWPLWPKRPAIIAVDSATYVFAHDQFARYQQSSNEPLRYHVRIYKTILTPTISLSSFCSLSVRCQWVFASLYKLLILQLEMGVPTEEKELRPGVTGNLAPQE